MELTLVGVYTRCLAIMAALPVTVVSTTANFSLTAARAL